MEHIIPDSSHLSLSLYVYIVVLTKENHKKVIIWYLPWFKRMSIRCVQKTQNNFWLYKREALCTADQPLPSIVKNYCYYDGACMGYPLVSFLHGRRDDGEKNNSIGSGSYRGENTRDDMQLHAMQSTAAGAGLWFQRLPSTSTIYGPPTRKQIWPVDLPGILVFLAFSSYVVQANHGGSRTEILLIKLFSQVSNLRQRLDLELDHRNKGASS